MKQKIIYITGLLIIFSTLPLVAQKQISEDPAYVQMMNDKGVSNLYDIKVEANNYFQGKDKGRGSGYKQYKRWEHFVEPRYSPSGKIFNIAAKNMIEYENYVANFNSKSLPANYHPGNWTSMGPDDHILGAGWNGGIGRVNCIAFHPTNSGIYYVGTPAGGLWKKSGSNPWEPLTDGLPAIGVSGIAIHHTNTNIIYILTGDGDGNHTSSIGVLKTTNGGLTWQPTALSWGITNSIRGYKLLQHPTNSYIQYAATTAGIYKTTDGWQSETLVRTGFFYDIEFKPGDPSTMYAATKYDFFRSTNGGNTWDLITNGLPTSGTYRIAIGVSPANANYVYLLYGRSTNGHTQSAFKGLYRSNNSGTSFNIKSSTPNILGYVTNGIDNEGQYSYDLAIAVSPTNIYEVHVGGINCWKSNNYGASWTITSYWMENSSYYQYTHADIHALEYSPIYPNRLYCGSDGGIYRTTNGGTNWYDYSDGLVITQFYRIGTTPQDIDKVVGGTQDNGGNTLNGNTFTHDRGADGFSALIDYTNTSRIFESTQAHLYRSTNYGTSFASITPSALVDNCWDVPWTMHPSTPTTLFVGQYDIWKSTNSGSNWTSMGTGNTNDFFKEIAHGVSYTQRIYAITANRIFMTANAGSTWSNISSGLPTSPDYSYIAVDPTYSSYVYMTFSGYNYDRKVYKSTNAGTTWTNWSGTLPNIPVNCIVVDNTSKDGVYIGTDVGVFYRDNTMSDWVPFFNQLPNVIVNEMEINYTSNKIIAGTFGRGIWQTSLYGNCNSQFILTNANNSSTSSTQYYAATNYITSTRTVYTSYNNTSVTYKAGNFIRLNPGFNTQYNAKFEALIGPCSGTVVNAPAFNIRDRVSGGLSGSYSATTNTE